MGRIHRPYLAWALAARAALIAASAGCEDPSPRSGEAWVASIRRPGDAAACDAIIDVDLAGECRAMAVRVLGQQGRFEEATAVCRSMAQGTWRHECFFLLSDARESQGDEAHQLCQEAGRYRSQCLSHAMARESHDLLEQSPRGSEAETFHALQAIVDRYAQSPSTMQRARLLMSNHLAARDPGAPFGPSQCGTIASELCRSAYAERVRLAGRDDQRWQSACPGPPMAQDLVALDLPVWADGWQDEATRAWSDICAGRTEDGRPEVKASTR